MNDLFANGLDTSAVDENPDEPWSDSKLSCMIGQVKKVSEK